MLFMEILQEFFSRLYHFDELIRWGGYSALAAIVFAETGLLVGFFLPGDSLLVSAGLIAGIDGILDIRFLTSLLCAAAILGDTAGYLIGYHLGPKIFKRKSGFFFNQEHVIRTQKFYDKHGPKTIVLARFVPIVRTFAPTVAGVARMNYRSFIVYNILGGVGWVMSMTLSGYWLGRVIPNIEKHIHILIGIVIVVSLIPIYNEWRASKSLKHPS